MYEKRDPLQIAAQVIYDKRGMNMIALDISEISTMTDCILIAEGNVDRHVRAIAQAIMDVLKEEGEMPAYVEGLESGDWVVLDYVHFVVHLFIPSVREKYQLERLWSAGKIVDLHIDLECSQPNQ